jgi:elongation factor Ts
MAVTMAEISKLRTMTGAGMMDCKNALTEAEGDFEKAIEIIRKKGQAVAAKRSDRQASEGCVIGAAKDGFAAIIALKCETDFVAKNADFVALTQSILDAAMAAKSTSLDAVKALNIDGRTIAELVTDRSGCNRRKNGT